MDPVYPTPLLIANIVQFPAVLSEVDMLSTTQATALWIDKGRAKEYMNELCCLISKWNWVFPIQSSPGDKQWDTKPALYGLYFPKTFIFF